jgi:hypothetical protein
MRREEHALRVAAAVQPRYWRLVVELRLRAGEWLAEMEALPGSGISKLLFAVSVVARVPAMAREAQRRRAASRKPEDLLLFSWALLILFLIWHHTRDQRLGEEARADGLLSGRNPVIARTAMWQTSGAIPAHNADFVFAGGEGSRHTVTVVECKTAPEGIEPRRPS